MTRAAKVLIVAVLLIAVSIGLYGVLLTHWSYSSGERAGWVQKLSRKGWVCKTWEGELSMVSMPGTTPEKFIFTVWNDQVAEQINRVIGRRVALRYEEKIGLPGSCFGETRYFVTGVAAVNDEPIASPASPTTAPAPTTTAPY